LTESRIYKFHSFKTHTTMGPAKKKQRLSNGAVAEIAENVTDNAAETTPTAAASTPAVEGKAEKEKSADDQHKRSLFVRSLPPSATSESLTALFSDSYPVKHAVAINDPATKLCRGFGFVTFADAEDAQRAKKEFNGHVIDGKKIRIEVAERRHREGEEGTEHKAKKEVEKVEARQPPKLIVRNLPWTIKNPKQLEKLFLSYGKVKQAYIPRKSGGLMAGFGFVLMRGRPNAEKAIAGVNGKEVDGRTIAVDWAVKKEEYDKTDANEEEDKTGVEQDDEDDEEEGSDGGARIDDDDESVGDDKDPEDEDDMDDEDEDEDEDGDMDDDMEDEEDEPKEHRPEDKSATLFIRNMPFNCTDEDLEDHFSQFGSVRYARVVMDHATGRSRGTGFVCFYDPKDAYACLREIPMRTGANAQEPTNKLSSGPSVLQNTETDPSGRYTLDGRVLQISQAVEKSQANKFTEEGNAHRDRRDKDKRRLFLLSEGTIASNTKLWESLPPSEQTMREASLKQRKTLIEGNPSLALSLTRLSVRNIPRSIDSKALKALAREAVVGFATELKQGKRQRISHEELERGGEDMIKADLARKDAGKGIVKQAKVVFESEGGSKVTEKGGAGRSRGYGFIEYYTHRSALMGLRWLNGHSIGYSVAQPQKGVPHGSKAAQQEALQDKKKRLIVEFAIENAQVVHRRNDREEKARERSKSVQQRREAGEIVASERTLENKGKANMKVRKRKRAKDEAKSAKKTKTEAREEEAKMTENEKTAKRNMIIGRKRQMRRNRK
jgi:nucleolar protein 4